MILEIFYITMLQVFVLSSAEVLRRWGVASIYTRKAAHIAAGVVATFLPYVVHRESALMCGALGVCIVGTLLWRGYLPAIGKAGAIDVGAMSFPLGLTVSALLFWTPDSFVVYQYAVLILAIPDAVAGLVGNSAAVRWPRYWGGKSYEGSAVFFVSASALSITCLMTAYSLDPLSSLIYGLAIGVFLTGVEAVSLWGIDNVSVPLAAGLLLTALL